MAKWEIVQGDCLRYLKEKEKSDIHLTFLDPPFNQGKDYRYFNDNLSDEDYWNWLKRILTEIPRVTVAGGVI